MKVLSSKVLRIVSMFWLAVWAVAPPASAQPGPTLDLRLYAGVNLTGAVGNVYAIQTTTNLASPNWSCAALVKLPATSYTWTDTSTSAAVGRRYYRAVLTATNLAYILPGTFTMGSPTNEVGRGAGETQHVVTITRGFWMGKYLVTQADYLAVVGSNPSSFSGNLLLPVETMSWLEASNYCVLRTQQERAAGLLPSNYAYRLPTESEWEYACRAGTTTAFHLGSGLHSGQANFNGHFEYEASVGTIQNPNGDYPNMTTPVGAYAANGWGLYDMIGNVFEWCQDWYDVYPTGSVTDPQGPPSGTNRVLRGGSWTGGAQLSRSAYRYNYNPAAWAFSIGFRVVLAPTQ